MRTGNITPQYHVVINEPFHTVPNIDFGVASQESSFLDHRWEELLRFHRDFYLPDTLTADELNSLPPLDEEWMTPDQARIRRLEFERDLNRDLLDLNNNDSPLLQPQREEFSAPQREMLPEEGSKQPEPEEPPNSDADNEVKSSGPISNDEDIGSSSRLSPPALDTMVPPIDLDSDLS